MRLPAEELSLLRKDAAGVLGSSCSIRRKTKTGNGGGSSVLTWTTIAASVPCRIAPEGNAPGVMAGRQDEAGGQILTVPFDVDLTAADQVVHDGSTYEVIEIPKRSSDDRFLVRARLARVD